MKRFLEIFLDIRFSDIFDKNVVFDVFTIIFHTSK